MSQPRSNLKQGVFLAAHSGGLLLDDRTKCSRAIMVEGADKDLCEVHRNLLGIAKPPAEFTFVDSSNSERAPEERKGFWTFLNADAGGITHMGFIHGSGKGIRAYLSEKFPSVTHWTITTYSCPHVE